MNITVNGDCIYCYTGGKVHVAGQPTVVFLHGVLNDHSVWILQSRWFAHHGWNVLALDYPGHCRSAGEPPKSVEEAAQFVVALLDAAGIERAALVGHSWGSLIALEAGARLKERATHAALIGFAYPMKVSQALLDASRDEPMKAIHQINVYSRATLAAPPSTLGPGTWIWGASVALNKRVLASNSAVNLFHRGFVACNSYSNGEAAIDALTCPVLFVLGQQDQMTPARAAQTIVKRAQSGGKSVTLAPVEVGHHLLSESPEATLAALRRFLLA